MSYPRSGKLIALYSVFNDAGLIEDSMRSLLGVVDEFRVYDGRYIGFDDPCGQNHTNSCDNTRRVVAEFLSENYVDGFSVGSPDPVWEFDKRQKMLDGLDIGDTAIVVDADEMFTGGEYGIDELQSFARANFVDELPDSGCIGYVDAEQYKIARVPFLGLEASHTWMHRVHVKTPNLRIVNSGHMDYTWYDDEGQWRRDQSYDMQFARFAHMKNNGLGAGFRPKGRDKAANDYSVKLIKGEVKH